MFIKTLQCYVRKAGRHLSNFDFRGNDAIINMYVKGMMDKYKCKTPPTIDIKMVEGNYNDAYLLYSIIFPDIEYENGNNNPLRVTDIALKNLTE